MFSFSLVRQAQPPDAWAAGWVLIAADDEGAMLAHVSNAVLNENGERLRRRT